MLAVVAKAEGVSWTGQSDQELAVSLAIPCLVTLRRSKRISFSRVEVM